MKNLLENEGPNRDKEKMQESGFWNFPKKEEDEKEGKKAKKGKKKRHISLWIILILLLIIAILIAFIYFTREKPAEPITSSLLKEELASAQELTTSKYYYTNLGSFENQKDFQGIKLPFTKKKFLVRYQGSISAGVDLSDLAIEVRGKTILIDLPPAEILSQELDDESFEVFDEETSIFNPFSVEDFQDFQKQLKEDRAAEAISRGILDHAQKNAGSVIRDLLMQDPNIKENYSIEIRGQDNS